MFDCGARIAPARLSGCVIFAAAALRNGLRGLDEENDDACFPTLNFLTSFTSTSIGRKWIVALTGLAMVGFLIGHLIGNLQIFLPPEHINQVRGLFA